MNDYNKAQELMKQFEKEEPIEHLLNYHGLSLWWFIRPGILGGDMLEQVTGEKRDTGRSKFSYYLFFKRIIVGLWRLLKIRKAKTLIFTRGKDYVDGKDQVFGDLFSNLDDDYLAIDFAITKNHMKQGLKRPSKFIPWETFLFLSIFFNPFIRFGRYRMESRLYQLMRKFKQYKKQIKSLFNSITNIETARSVIRKYNIERVLCVDERCSGLAVIAAAKLESIKSYGIQHGLISNINSGYNSWEGVNPILPDKTFVWGPVHKAQLQGLGYKSDQVEIVGIPRLENIKPIKIVQNDHNVVYFAQHAMTDEMKQKIIGVFKQLPKYYFFIKLHPEERSKVFLRAKGDNYQTYSKTSVSKTLENCDIVLGHYSTTLMDAAVYNKPIVILNLMDTEDITGLTDYGLATEINHIGALSDTLKKVKVKDNRLYMHQYCWTEDVTDKIIKVVNYDKR